MLAVSAEALAQARYSTDAAAAEALCRAAAATIVLAPASSRFTRIAAGVAHRLGGFVDTHITALSATPAPSKPLAGSIVSAWRPLSAAKRAPGSCSSMRARIAAFAAETGHSQEWKQIAVELPLSRTTVTGQRSPLQEAQTIRPDAKLLFVAGAGWTKKQADGQIHASEAGKLILGLPARYQRLARQQQIARGSTRRGSAGAALPYPHEPDWPDRRHATPLQGLVDLLPWRRTARGGLALYRRAPRHHLDPNCGWTRGKADVVYVADAFQVMAKVNALLEEKKDSCPAETFYIDRLICRYLTSADSR